jgi:hypothetical protein
VLRPSPIFLALAILTAAAGARAAPPAPGPAAGGGDLPEVDPLSVVLYPDQGRIELRATRLLGTRLRWQTSGGSGESACVDPRPAGRLEQCAFAVARDLPADASLYLLAPLAPGAPPSGGAAMGLLLRPARVVLDKLLPAANVVDLTSGIGRIPLSHPEAVAAVDCAPAHCELAESAIFVRSVVGTAATLTLRLRLGPRYLLAKGDLTEATIARAVSVLHCPAAVVSGSPLRRADATRMIVRIDARCGHDAQDMRWTVNGKAVEVERVEKVQDALYAQLAVGDVEDTQVTVIATRPEPDEAVIAVARAATIPAPEAHATLELPGFGRINFLPTNRDAVLHMAPAGDHARLVPLPVEGAYRVTSDGHTTRVRGDESAGGFVALRFGYRIDGLPAPFAATDLAVITEALQRPIREASVPAPFGPSTLGGTPLVELNCVNRAGEVERIRPGSVTSIPYAQRDSCRLIIHRERLSIEDGTQDITVDVSVTKLDDSPRPDAHVSERMALRPGHDPRVFWIHGVKAQFDRVSVRVSHVIDEAHDVGGTDLHVNVPAAQWAVIVGEGHFRFYATATIPTGLFRITAPSDVLLLNFGALSRLTWLDKEGHEGLLGLEAGAIGIGLAATPGFPRTLAALLGIGVSVPIGNRGEPTQASVGLHAWLAYELRSDVHVNSDGTGPLASHFAFYFGPSITIGNVGTNL